MASFIARNQMRVKLDGGTYAVRRAAMDRYISRVRTFRNVLLVTVGLALVAYGPSLGFDEEPMHTGRSLGESAEGRAEEFVASMKFRIGTSILCLVTIIVIFSVCMEKFVLDPLKEDVEENLKPIVNTLFSELTLLGFVGLFMFIVTKLKLMEPLSMKIFHESTALQELFEAVHMVLFLVMCIFLSSATLLLYYGHKAEKHWSELNARAVDDKENILKDYVEAFTNTDKVKQRIARDEITFLALRHRFIYGDANEEELKKPAALEDETKQDKDKKKDKDKKMGWGDIPRDFDFHDYLAVIQGKTTGEIIEIPVVMWTFLEVMMAFFYLFKLGLDSFWFSVVFIAAAYLLMILVFAMDRKLNKAIVELTPKYFEGKAKEMMGAGQTMPGYNTIDQNASVHPSGENSAPKDTIPSYKFRDLYTKEEWGSFREKILGWELPMHQDMLFWGGKCTKEEGESDDEIKPQLMLMLIRIQLMWSAIYISVFIVVLMRRDIDYFKGHPAMLVIYFCLIVLPVIVNMVQLNHITRNYVISSSVEELKKPEVIRRVRRRMTTKKAVNCLKLLKMMKSNISKTSLEIKDATEIYTDPVVYQQKERELKELFELFDKDGSGEIETSEMTELLELLKMDTDEKSVAAVIEQVDADNSGQVDFSEFFNWMASQDDPNMDTKEWVTAMFKMIDTDDSGKVTPDEFKDALQKLGTTLSMEDIQGMIREVDADGDGDIDEEEFCKMVEKHLEGEV